MITRAHLVFGLLLSLVLPAPAALAQEPGELPAEPIVVEPSQHSLELGAFVGVNLVLDDWDIHQTGDFGEEPDTSALVGLRVTATLVQWLAIEGGVGLLPATTPTQGFNLFASLTIDALIKPFEGDWMPFLAGGTGLYLGLAGDFGNDVDSRYQWGLGVQGPVADVLGLRVDARHVMTDGYIIPRLAHNVEIYVGIDWLAWEDPPVLDTDGDGLVDEQDRCPRQRGTARTNGCPDADGDGIADAEDSCPDQAGAPALSGCPDSDGDGIADREDRCPEVAGQVSAGGCPDRDGDGVADTEDACPDKPGSVAAKGCPVERPDPPAPDPPQPDPPRSGEQIAELFFLYNSARLLDDHFPTLDDLAARLKANPRVEIVCECHADARGSTLGNQLLSEKRCKRVRKYLERRGVAASRMSYKSWGETKPRSANDDEEGRRDNRRVQIRTR